MEVFILIFLPIAFILLADLYKKITTTPEERAKEEADNEKARALLEVQNIKDQKAWQEKTNSEQGWKNELLNGEYQLMPSADKEKYLSSDKWKLIRNAVIERDKSCTTCGSYHALNVHHLHYLRLGRENLNDLIALCKSCHFDLHEKKGYSRQGLYAPEGYKGMVPSHQELKEPRYNEYWTPTGFKTKPEYEKHQKPTVFHTEYEYVGSVRIGAKLKSITILKDQIEKTTRINLSHISMAKGHSLDQLNKLKNLKCLELKNCNLTNLPEEIGELIHLEVLDISENHLLSLPDFLGNLTNLKCLILPEKPYLSNLVYISEDLEGLPFLNHTSIKSIKLLSKNETPLLPQTVKNTSVEKVLTRSNELMSVTQGVLPKARATKELAAPKDDSWIDRLYAWADKNDIPDLTWSERQYTYIGLPRDKSKLRNLTKLYLEENQLTELPPEIGQLTNLTKLYLEENQLTELPPEIGQLTNLTYLRLDDNQLNELPPAIGLLRNLTSLWLQENQLTELPPEIGQLTNLTYLYLSDNNLSELPEEIFNLPNLEAKSRGNLINSVTTPF